MTKIPAAAATAHTDWKPPPGPYRIFISCPCDDGHKVDFWRSILDLQRASYCGQTPHALRFFITPGDSLIPRARNAHMRHFYFNTADDWFMPIDSDLDFRSVDVFRLFENPGPIMAGVYALKTPDSLRWCLNAIPGHEMDPKTKRQHVATAGTGFLAIHRHVIGTLIAESEHWKHWPVRFLEDESGNECYDLFHNGVVHDPEWFPRSPRYLSEDWGFCYMARKHGFTIQADYNSAVQHEGSIKYPLQMRRLTREEEMAGIIKQPDGSTTPIK